VLSNSFKAATAASFWSPVRIELTGGLGGGLGGGELGGGGLGGGLGGGGLGGGGLGGGLGGCMQENIISIVSAKAATSILVTFASVGSLRAGRRVFKRWIGGGGLGDGLEVGRVDEGLWRVCACARKRSLNLNLTQALRVLNSKSSENHL
jgi:hypothetical protein